MPAAYQSVAAEVRRAIEAGEYRPGDLLPPITDLAAQYGVAKNTAQAAVRLLQGGGYVKSTPGTGTVVLDRSAVRVAFSRYSSVLQPGGTRGPWETACDRQGVNGSMVLLDAAVEAAPDDVAAALGIDPGAEVVRRTRHATIDDQVVQLQTAWYPGAVAAGTPLAGTAKIEGGVFGALIAAGRRPASADEAVSVRQATPEEEPELGIRNAAVMVVERVTRDVDGTALEFLRVVANPDRTRLVYDGLPMAGIR